MGMVCRYADHRSETVENGEADPRIVAHIAGSTANVMLGKDTWTAWASNVGDALDPANERDELLKGPEGA